MSKLFPTVDQIVALREKPTTRRGRSLWLGVSQLALNLPRILVVGLFIAAFEIVSSVFRSIFSIAVMVIITPLVATFAALTLGFAGRLDDADSEAAASQRTNPLLIMMDLKQKRDFDIRKGSSSADSDI